MLRRLRYTGEEVPLSDQWPKSVGFLFADEDGEPVGTGFLVNYSGRIRTGNPPFTYLVTAAHVADKARFFRINRDWFPAHLEGAYQGDITLDVGTWVPHKTADVALSPLQRNRPEGQLRVTGIPLRLFVDMGPPPHYFNVTADLSMDQERDPLLGDRIYYVGLIEYLGSMIERNMPLVRSGTLAARYEPGVPIKRSDGTEGTYDYPSHLVDCRLLSGFSGSPCFVQHEVFPSEKQDQVVPPWLRQTRLLGLMGAFFNAPLRTKGRVPRGDPFELTVDMNAGIGVVVPAEAIREVLEYEVLVKDREKEKAKDKVKESSAAELAAAPEKDGEYERFERLVKTVVSVPKDEATKRSD